jgi:hypothetical protein
MGVLVERVEERELIEFESPYVRHGTGLRHW